MDYDREEEVWHDGFRRGIAYAQRQGANIKMPRGEDIAMTQLSGYTRSKPKKPRKLSAWQKFVKTNSKMPRFKYKTGKRKGMVNMKALAAAWKRKKKR